MKNHNNTPARSTCSGSCRSCPSACPSAEYSRYFNAYNPVYVSQRMTGKMEGIPSISTAATLNAVCQARATVPGSICSHCYAAATIQRYGALRAHLEDNFRVLNSRDLLPEELPAVYSDVCRLESFGDLASVTQARNYIRIARRSPWCRFTLWTKNPEFMAQALAELGRPENMLFVYSSPDLNRPALEILARFPWFDRVFTVYDAATIERDGVEINCGARSCRSCMLCYTPGGPVEVREKLK